MKIMTLTSQKTLTDLDDKMRENGLQEDLKAARALAHDGHSVRDIEGMMRFLLSREQIVALLDEAGQPVRD